MKEHYITNGDAGVHKVLLPTAARREACLHRDEGPAGGVRQRHYQINAFMCVHGAAQIEQSKDERVWTPKQASNWANLEVNSLGLYGKMCWLARIFLHSFPPSYMNVGDNCHPRYT